MCKFSPTLSKSKPELNFFKRHCHIIVELCFLFSVQNVTSCNYFITIRCVNAVDVTFICRVLFFRKYYMAGNSAEEKEAAVQLLLVWSVELSADCRLKSPIRSDCSRLSKSPRSSWSICVEEGQTSVRRHSTQSKYI